MPISTIGCIFFFGKYYLRREKDNKQWLFFTNATSSCVNRQLFWKWNDRNVASSSPKIGNHSRRRTTKHEQSGHKRTTHLQPSWAGRWIAAKGTLFHNPFPWNQTKTRRQEPPGTRDGNSSRAAYFWSPDLSINQAGLILKMAKFLGGKRNFR
jgi:hypothetical protein